MFTFQVVLYLKDTL